MITCIYVEIEVELDMFVLLLDMPECHQIFCFGVIPSCFLLPKLSYFSWKVLVIPANYISNPGT